jgi:hypothetical protein
MKLRLIILLAILLAISACSVQINQSNTNNSIPKNENTNNAKSEPTKEVATNVENGTALSQKSAKLDNSACYKLTRDDLMIDKKQTFALDFKPFEGSCFVTFHDPEFDNPPLGSQYFIYKDGKEIFNFPDNFNGGNAGCWIDAVSFEDLNNDQLKDIIIVGKCGAKMGDYNENMVYINNGKEFVTNVEANEEMMDFKKISQIQDFVKKNPTMFSK